MTQGMRHHRSPAAAVTAQSVRVLVTGAGAKPPQILRAGDVAEVPPGLVHWHGALAGHLFAHISFVETDGSDNTTWMEPVDEGQYQSPAVAP